VARRRSSSIGTATVEFDGLMETLKAFQTLELELRRESNAELRRAAKTCATVLAGKLYRSAASSATAVASRVARSIRVKSDRIPVVSIGGSLRVGRRGAPAGVLVWGSEQGPKGGGVNHWGAPPSSGYWIAPVVAAFQRDEAVDVYRRAIVDLERSVGLI